MRTCVLYQFQQSLNVTTTLENSHNQNLGEIKEMVF